MTFVLVSASVFLAAEVRDFGGCVLATPLAVAAA
jgi:hypothetical protein